MYRNDIVEGKYDTYHNETDEKWYQIMSERDFQTFNTLNKEYQEIVKKYRLW